MNLLRPSLLAIIFTLIIGGRANAATAPLITQQPVSATVAAGNPVTFSVSAFGDPTLSYQWQKAGADIESATESSYVIPSVQAADAAVYTVTITNGAGNQTSAPAVLVVGTKTIRYVKTNATGSNNGSSWANAFTSLTSALTAAVDGDEIWVAAGTYKPSTVGNRDSYFAVAKVLTILGGFAGTESTASERNWNTNVTILSGDLAGNDTGPGGNQGDNSKQVMVYEANANAVIDGFRITGGRAPGSGSPDAGGGIFIGDGRVATVRNCTFYWNYAISYGGGLGSYAFGALTLEGCYFHNNSAPSNGGGGLFLDSSPGSHCIIKRSLFASNSGSAAGGALFHTATTAYIENSVFTANSSGGGLQSGVAAGAIRGFTTAPGRFWITNCTFSANTNTRGTAGAISLFAPNDGNSTLANSIVVGSGSNPVTFPTSPAYLLSDQSIAGTGNVVGTPTFVNSGNPLGVDGVFGTRDDGFVLTAASPGVDSGSATVAPLIDATGVSRPQGAGVERGAYETLVPPQISAQPQSISVAQGAPGTLQVSHTGVGPFSYQWMKDSVDIPGSTASTLNIASTQPWHIGDYRVKITDTGGTVTSNLAALSLIGINTGIWKGLMAYYDFDGDVQDKTAFARHLTNTGAVATSDRKAEPGGSAYAFNGTTAKMVASGYKGETGAGARTISLWIKPANTLGGFFFSYGTPTWEVSDRGKDFKFYLSATNSKVGLDANWVGSDGTFAGALAVAVWHHLVVTVPQGGLLSDMKYFLDGIPLAGSSSTSRSPLNLDTSALVDLTLGGEDDRGVYQSIPSTMDDVRIYNRALSAPEIAALFEFEDPDTDHDGIRDRFETGTGIYVSATNSGTSPTLADTDGDGLNDGSEVAQYGSNPNIKDTDSDGFEDGFELLTGFNPTLATSTPEALSAMLPAVEFRFNAANGISYRIESSTDLTTWGTIENTITGAGVPVIRFYTTDGILRRFYRARRN